MTKKYSNEYKKFKTPSGGFENRPGPHKVDLFERDVRPLLKGWTTKEFQNKVNLLKILIRKIKRNSIFKLCQIIIVKKIRKRL